MTRHDPFSYGQVQLGADKNADAGTPDDLLFADAGPAKKAAPADPSWELLDADVPLGLTFATALVPVYLARLGGGA